MLGTIVNAVSVVIGSLLGLFLKGGIPEKINDTVMKGLGLFVVFTGITGTLEANNFVLIVFSIALGSVVGEAIDIDMRMQKLGDSLQARFKGRGGKVSEAFVASSLLFCVGAMAIVGSLESGLAGDHSILFTKSMLDGIVSIVFASSLGVGVIISSITVLLYQGIITLAAAGLKSILVTAVINDMTAVGSLLIIGMGLNMLGTTKIKTANMLPGIFIPILYQGIDPFIKTAYHYIVSLF